MKRLTWGLVASCAIVLGVKFTYAADTPPSVSSAPAGCLIEHIASASSAETSGLKVGDRILEVDTQPIQNPEDLQLIVRRAQDALSVVISRDGSTETVKVALPPVTDTAPRLGVRCADPKTASVATVQKNVISTLPHRIYPIVGFTLPGTQVEFPNGEEDPISETGPAFGVQYLYMTGVDRKWGLGVEALYHGFKPAESDVVISGANSSMSLKTLTALFIARRTFMETARVAPYFFGGLGFATHKLSWELTPSPGIVWVDSGTRETRTLIDDTQTAIAGALGLGFDGRIGKHWLAGLEFRLTETGEAKFKSTSAGQAFGGDLEGDVGIFSMLFRVGYQF